MNSLRSCHCCPRRPLPLMRWLGVLLLVLGTLVGCASQNKGFDDEMSDQAGKLRPTKKPGQKLGLSPQSRQIESDLGIQ